MGWCLTGRDILQELIRRMSNWRVRELQNVWEGILEDASRAFPTLRMEFERDLTRLQRAVEHRGIRVFLEDLPAIGKHFDRCLSCGQYNASGLPLSKRCSETVVIPKFLRGLYLLVFHSSTLLKDDYDVEAIFFIRQLTLAFKKGKLRCTAEEDEKEVVSFFTVDSCLPEPDGFWCTTDSDEAQGPTVFCTDDRGLHLTLSADPASCNTSLAGDVTLRHRGTPSGVLLGGEAGSARRMTFEGFRKSPLYQERVLSLPPQLRRKMSSLLANLDFVSGLVTASLGSYDPGDWRFSHGSGAVSEYRGPANKYSWINWSETLESEYPIADYGFHSFSSWGRQILAGREISSKELPSRMACVPKTYSKPRLIAMEPSANMWCQQNIWDYFSERSKRCWIYGFVRFDDQTLNQQLCKKGSLNGMLATIDLSEASDRVTCHAVGQLFRGNPRLLSCLRASRTQIVSQNVTKLVPSEIRLRKFSTMGNACTFPVESLLFLSIAVSTVLTQRGRRPTKKEVESLQGEVAVFGDDVVIPTECRELFTEALKVLDFKVNDRKSFWSGNFRESCGVDAFRGVEVTPAYWRTFSDGGPASLASTIATRNNFYKKFLIAAADRLASTIPQKFAIPVVHMRSGVIGLKSFMGPNTDGFKTRWNEDLQRPEVRISDLVCREHRLPINDDSALLQFFTEDPDPLTKWKSGIPQRPVTKIRPRWVALTDLGAPCVEAK